MPVDSTHQQYADSLDKWQIVRDCVAGAKAVRGRGETYLPNPDESAADKDERYKNYLKRAQFVNVLARTRNALVGMAFRKEPEYELPSQLEYLQDNASGNGLSLEQIAKQAVGDLLETGRYGLLADYPVAEEGQSAAQTESITASIKTYKPESIINWSTTIINGVDVLSLVVLKELVEVNKDDFKVESIEQFRALKLVNGVYTQEVWREGELYSTADPRQANGADFGFIPFIMAGAYSNDPNVDDAALYDIAELNIGHYRNSADYEESVFLVGQPQPVISGLTQSWIDNANGEYKFGSRVAWTLPEAGSADILQVQPNTMAMEAMGHKEQQMVMIGARIIQRSGQAETAEAARIKHAGDNSVLTNIVQNASDAITKAIEWCGLFMGSEGGTIAINDDFYDKTQDAQQIMADIQLLDRGVIAKSDVRDKLRKTGALDAERTDEDIDTEVGDISAI